MKKLLFILLSALSLTSFAQTKKVAILEVVDREGKLNYGYKMMLRSNLARAITNTVGYEAYDRTDMDVIMSEHDFQRTGLVTEAQIKQLGQMTGVSLILVAEGAFVGNNSMFVSAKILNVETAKVEKMDNITMGLETMAMQQGCTTLANRLLGSVSSGAGNNQSNVDQRRNQYTQMNKKEYEWFLFNNCPKAYEQYKVGKQLSGAGWGVFAGGLALGGLGLALFFSDIELVPYHYEAAQGAASRILMSIGFTSAVGGGIPLIAIGSVRKNRAYKLYYEQCSSSAAPISFNLTAGQNGLGVAMNF